MTWLPHAPGSAAGTGTALLDWILTSGKPVFPIPALLVILPVIYLFFRKTWRQLDQEAHEARGVALERGETDKRPLVALAMCAVILTMQEYYGGRGYFEEAVHPSLAVFDARHGGVLRLLKYEDLYGFGWWVGTRVFGYVVVPFTVWKIAFRGDSLLDMGLRVRGFFNHAWIYALFLGCVLPAMWVVSRQPDFGSYYPFYKQSSRSWFDFFAWESMYFVQFFALEVFFRGFWLGALRRSFGSGAIFVMAVPYCMIHYGKPYLEANGAIVAGIALGSLSMRTKSIYQGFLVHITVAGLMDWLALSHRNALPTVLWPGGELRLDAAGNVLNPVRQWVPIVALAALGLLVATAVSVKALERVRSRRAAAAQPSGGG